MKRGLARGLASAAYLVAALSLASALLVLCNMLASRLNHVFHLPGHPATLSQRTAELAASLGREVEITALIPSNDPLYPPLRDLLEAFKGITNASFKVSYADPYTDLARSTEAARRYGVAGLAVIFDDGTRQEVIPYDALLQKPAVSGARHASLIPPRFCGDQACARALTRLGRPKPPVAYALGGHGERDFASYDPLSGYSDFAREIDRAGLVLRPLPTAADGVPADCDLLIVAGPRHAPAPAEADAIRSYLGQGGRLLFLADTPGGWESVLSRVGLAFAGYIATGNSVIGGDGLLSDRFGETPHRIAEHLERSAVFFVNPQVIDLPGPNRAETPENLVATPVVYAPKGAWGESSPDILPRRFDKNVDREGPLPLVVAVEGPGDDRLGLRPLRAVVAGDSSFAANAQLEGGSTANSDLLVNAVNWLTEGPLATDPSSAHESGVLRLAISRSRQIRFWLRSVLAWPLLAGAFGLLMARLRRYIS